MNYLYCQNASKILKNSKRETIILPIRRRARNIINNLFTTELNMQEVQCEQVVGVFRKNVIIKKKMFERARVY